MLQFVHLIKRQTKCKYFQVTTLFCASFVDIIQSVMNWKYLHFVADYATDTKSGFGPCNTFDNAHFNWRFDTIFLDHIEEIKCPKLYRSIMIFPKNN